MANVIYLNNLTKDFLDAVEMMSEFILGQRLPTDWGVAASVTYLTGLGLNVPTKAIPADQLRLLKDLVAFNKVASANPLKVKATQIKAAESLADAFNASNGGDDFISSELGAELRVLSTATGSTDTEIDPTTSSSLDEIAAVLANGTAGTAADAMGPATNLHATQTPDAVSDYSQIPAELTAANASSTEYDAVGPVDASIYDSMPEPPAHYEDIVNAERGL